VAGINGKLPTPSEYFEYTNKLDTMAGEVYRYLNFDQLSDYTSAAEKVIPMVEIA
jgi:aconitate hydratase 2 / 2-methylisocitrate dehydratase